MALARVPGPSIHPELTLASPGSVTVALAQKQLLHLAQKVSTEEAANVVATCERTVQIGLILSDLVSSPAFPLHLDANPS